VDRLLIVVAVQKEADALGGLEDIEVVVSGLGRTNAACATTEALLDQRASIVISAGIAGSLPPHDLAVGDIVVASSCVYAEEGLVTPEGFSDVQGLGFPLGDFAGNEVPVCPQLLSTLSCFPTAPIATVATCSGTDAAADAIASRTGAAAEAMEGAAVVHAARRLGVPAIEIRAISNRTGNREDQGWDLDLSLHALGIAAQRVMTCLAT